MASALDVIKIAVRPKLQVQGKLVEVFARHAAVVEILIKIDFAIAVEIMETCNLIPAENIDFALDDL